MNEEMIKEKSLAELVQLMAETADVLLQTASVMAAMSGQEEQPGSFFERILKRLDSIEKRSLPFVEAGPPASPVGGGSVDAFWKRDIGRNVITSQPWGDLPGATTAGSASGWTIGNQVQVLADRWKKVSTEFSTGS